MLFPLGTLDSLLQGREGLGEGKDNEGKGPLAGFSVQQTREDWNNLRRSFASFGQPFLGLCFSGAHSGLVM